MMRLAEGNDPLLGRPLALYDVVTDANGNPDGLDIVYLVVGKMTRRLAELKPEAKLEIWGPLGNGFPVEETEHLIMVAGGIGQTPFLALAREYLGLQSLRRSASASSQSQKSYALLRRTIGGISGRRGRFRTTGHGCPAKHRRRFAGPSRTGYRVDRTGGQKRRKILPDRVLRPGADVGGNGQDRREAGHSLPGVVGNSHGLRHRNML